MKKDLICLSKRKGKDRNILGVYSLRRTLTLLDLKVRELLLITKNPEKYDIEDNWS